MNFWPQFKAAWNLTRFVPYVPEADAEDFWTEDDATNLSRFFDSYSGRKLKVRLTNIRTQSACNAVQQTGDYAHNTGIAAGIGIGIGILENHFAGQSVSAEVERSEDETALDALVKGAVQTP